jgi:uncharacterized membrane protein YphA (DoxX/SURF4 family)
MNGLLQFIDKLRQQKLIQIFTIYLRYLVGGAFIMSAFLMGKVTGTAMPVAGGDLPLNELPALSQFFKVISASGLYWKFIGWSQITCGVLLLTQRFAKLGALIFIVIILNIFVITISYDFTGTPLITSLMLLAGIYLLFWDYESFLFLITDQSKLTKPILPIIDDQYWKWLGFILVFVILIGTTFKGYILILFGAPFIAGLIGLIVYRIKFWEK